MLANVDGRGPRGRSSTTSRTRSDEVDFPLGYHAELLGEYAERQAAQDRLRAVLADRRASGSSCCCMAVFGSLRLALLTFLTLPIALVGGCLAV